MKKFFSVISLQEGKNLEPYVYQAMGNQRLQMDRETRFPIIAAMSGYLEAGDEFSVVVAVLENNSSKDNLQKFKDEVAIISQERGAVCKDIHEIWVSGDQRVAAQIDTFQKIIDYVEDEDELFCCITYGTKPLSTAVMMAVQYAYRVKRNTSLECIVYGEVLWQATPRAGRIYDMTALIQLDEIVRVLADRKIENPKEVINMLMTL